ncbi:MAG: cytochrome c [Bauldia sp.]
MRPLLAAALLAAAHVASAQEVGDPQAGLAYALVNCTECHAVEPDDWDSPFVKAPPFEEVANTRGVSDVALLSFFQTSHETMPNFVIAEPDMRDLVAYIRSLKD